MLKKEETKKVLFFKNSCITFYLDIVIGSKWSGKNFNALDNFC